MGPPPLTICVVGTGSIGLRHLKLLKSRPDVTVLAAPRRRERAAELRAMGFETVDPSVLGTTPVDAAVVASDTAHHVADSLKFGSNVHLLVEKPAASDAASMLPLRSRTYRSAHVACVLRFNPGLVWVRERLQRIGLIQSADAECLSWLPSWRGSHDFRESYSSRPAEGGVLRDLIHEIDYLHWLLGPTACVNASVWNSGQLGLAPELDESAVATLRTRAGVHITLRLSFATRPASRILRIWGERGLLTWDAIERRSTLRSVEGELLESTTWADSLAMYADQLESWLQFMREGQPSELATLDDGFAALRVIDAMRASSVQRKEITLP